ncbi:hypothetical protein [Mucilaginibacter sp. FT3.2]|uniref:hypothetical protein n=1 Tax=Mucilaginibacter sp. FT3.2 TaxID=2723090 RepID=UPI0016200987|nr:hypothetical protein [Mucilaginibacter sp. FT3.2]MBB6234294.1 hypothetical protein [Mucilaginibacter sp. FT3.2]
MKRVVDKHTVAHLWANRLQTDARTATGNFYFENEKIWSYGSHFLIAYHAQNDNGEHAVVITRNKYSVTTSEQVSIVRAASSHLNQLIVPDAGISREPLLKKWYNEITGIAANLQRARKPEKYIYQIRTVIHEARRYADFFGFELPACLRKAGEIQNAAQYAEVLENENTFRKKEEEKNRIEEQKIHRLQLKDWRALKSGYIKKRDGFDYLRFDKSTNRVQTSQRVEIPATIARNFYALVLDSLTDGGCKNCKMTLMDRYEVNEINKDFIKVGCHKISIKEIK